ncbi:MAG: transposase, partial [Bacteroidales bacterium]|nr:transposase [Bacteroidales bacterium]
MIIKCPKCGNLVTDRVAECPSCGEILNAELKAAEIKA